MPGARSPKKYSRTVLKRQRKTETLTERNKSVKSALKTSEKRVRTADADTVVATYNTFSSDVDKAASKRLIHPNKANRKKSRLAKLLNSKVASN